MISDIEKARLNVALEQITTALNTIQGIRDTLSEEAEEKLGMLFGAIESHGTDAEKAGQALWKEVDNG